MHLWGAEDIAARLIDELLFDDRAVRRLAQCLPEIERIHDEEAASHAVPAPDRQQIIRADVDVEIAKKLESSMCMAITGVAGLGKSAAAAAFAIKHRDDFNLTIWFDPGEIKRPEDLQSVPLIRGGGVRNVSFSPEDAGMPINHRRCRPRPFDRSAGESLRTQVEGRHSTRRVRSEECIPNCPSFRSSRQSDGRARRIELSSTGIRYHLVDCPRSSAFLGPHRRRCSTGRFLVGPCSRLPKFRRPRRPRPASR